MADIPSIAIDFQPMYDKYSVYPSDPQPRPAAEIAAERREQIAQERAAQQADKDRNLARQRSIETAPATRIALWESRHGLAMPRDPGHPLMRYIAECTGLDLAQVEAEHQRRALSRTTAAR
jgi:hypothetical protein